jgi:TonB family protein
MARIGAAYTASAMISCSAVQPRRAVIVLGIALLCARPAAAEPQLVPPVLVEQLRAPYPHDAEVAGIEGVVGLELLVDETGKVTSASVTRPAGNGFDEAALAAVKAFVFRPATYDGKPVPVKITYRYQFVLQHAAPPPPAVVDKPAEPPVRLQGSVSERGTRDPIGGAQLVVTDAHGHELGTAEADATGAFTVHLPAELQGTVTVMVAAPGHKPLKVRETLREHDVVTVKYALARTSYATYESVVRGQPAREEVSRVSLDGDEVRRIPGTKGDALAAVLNMPSVARSPFDLGQLVIRGSQPGESGAFLLGMTIPQAYHFALSVSTFNSFLLERFDLIPSNFSVRYGRLTGGIVDIVPREGKTDRLHGDIKVDVYDAHAIVEGPLGKGSFALSVRRSYIDAILGAVLPSSGFTVAPRYYDYQAMLDQPIGGGKFKLVVYGSDDAADIVQKGPSDMDPSLRGEFSTRFWFHSLLASYTKKWQKLESETTVLVSGQHQEAALGQAARFNLSVVETDLRQEVRYKLTPQAKFTFGLDLMTDQYWVTVDAPQITTEEKVQPPLGASPHKQLNNSGFETYPAVYAQVEWKPNPRVVLTPGVRVDWFSGYDRTYVQPRGMARVRLVDELWLKAGAGLYHQPPQSPYNNPVLGNPAVRPEQAIHVTLGLEARPLRRWRPLLIDMNVFYKDIRYLAVSSDFYQLRDGKPVPEVYTDEGYGRVYGADLLIKHDSPKYVYGWIAYTIMKAERQDHPNEPFRPFEYDQTHILTLVLGTHLPKDIDVGVRVRYVTGNPDTPQFANGMTIYDADHDVYYSGQSAPFSSRLPDFFQLDLRVDKRFAFKSWIFAMYLDITNVTNRANVEGYAYSYDFTKRAPVSGLPILPSLGLRASF